MPGGTGEVGPVAATSTRMMSRPSKLSSLTWPQSGSAREPVAWVAGVVSSQAKRSSCALTALIPETATSSSPTPSPTAAAKTIRRMTASRPPLMLRRRPRPIMVRLRLAC